MGALAKEYTLVFGVILLIISGILCLFKDLKYIFTAIAVLQLVSLQSDKQIQDEQQNEQQKQFFHDLLSQAEFHKSNLTLMSESGANTKFLVNLLCMRK